jgi:hypothetical protein
MKIWLIVGFMVMGLFLVGTLGYLVFLPTTLVEVSPIVVADIPGSGSIPGVPEVVFIAVTGISPKNLAISQSLQQSIIVTFDEEMNPATVNSDTFTIRGPDNVSLGGEIRPDSTGKIWTLNPTDSLKLNTKYQIMITTNAKGISGNGLAEDFFASFTTVVAQR